MTINTPWPEHRTAEAVKLYLGGMSASQVARQLGGGLTRSAVVGKMFRMRIYKGGYGGRPGDEALRARRKVREPSLPKVSVVEIPECGCATEAPSPALQVEIVANSLIAPEAARSLPPATGGSVPLINLEPRHCRWVVGDPKPRSAETLFCGADRVGGSPYCEQHRNQARREPDTRERKQVAKLMRVIRRRKRAGEQMLALSGAAE